MTRRARLIRRAALGAAIVIAAAELGRLLLTPVTGDVLLLLTARQADHVAATSVDLHSAQGWMTLGSIPARAVPKAPETAEAFLARVPVGSYDRVRLAGVSVPVALGVQKDILNPLLVGVDAGLFLQLRQRLPPSILLVEVTTDPSEDTPSVLRDYAGRIGASWTFATADPQTLAAFWKPFDVVLSTSDVHRSTLALIARHGYIRTYFLGAPDVGGTLPAPLDTQLSAVGRQLLLTHGNGWGDSQILDALQAVGGLASPSSSGAGPAPAFTLETLDGQRVSLADFRGRPVLINFWATYCAPCRREMPLIEQTAAQHPRLVVLLIDERDSHQPASAFVNELQITSTVLFDGDGKVGDAYGISGLPTTFFIHPDGEIEGRYIGETNAGILGPHIVAIGA